jgi:hypothetical protein
MMMMGMAVDGPVVLATSKTWNGYEQEPESSTEK